MSDEERNIGALDLGTSTSVCAVIQSGVENPKATVMEHGTGSGLMPSIVAFDKDNKPLVGLDVERAIADGSVNWNKVIKHAKRNIGSDRVYLDAKGNPVSSQQAQAYIAQRMVELMLANTYWKKDDVRIVVTYPIGFSDNAKKLYRDALEDVGIHVDVKDFYNEAHAAMMAIAKEMDVEVIGKTAMIIDIGGGTLDIVIATVVERDGEMVVLTRSLASDPQLGGTNYDLVVRNEILQNAESSLHIPASTLWDDPGRQMAITRWAETTKIKLCTYQRDQEYAFNLPTGEIISGTIRWEDFKAKTEDLTNTVASTCKKALESAINDTVENLQKLELSRISSVNDIDMVVFVGGGSKVPTIREKVAEIWPELKNKMSEAIDPQFVVAMGAAYLAKSKKVVVSRSDKTLAAKIRDSDTGELYGSVHIYENDVLPATVEEAYCTPGSAVTKSGLLSVKNWPKEKGPRVPLRAGKKWGEISIDTPEQIEGQEIKIKIQVEHNGIATMTATVNGREEVVTFELTDDMVNA